MSHTRLPFDQHAVGGQTKNRPTSPTKAEAEHDRHSRAGVRGDTKKHGAGSKGTWGSIEDEIKHAMEKKEGDQ